MLRLIPSAALLVLLVTSGPVAAQGLSIGFVDVQKVIFEYKKTTEITRTLENRIRQERAIVKQKKAALRLKIEERQMAPVDEKNAGVLERAKFDRDIRLAQIDIELSEKSAIIQLEQDLVEHMKKVYKEVRREAQAIALDRGLKAVFMVADDKISGRTRDEVSSEILVRPVLWFDPSHDLTAELLQRLNK